MRRGKTSGVFPQTREPASRADLPEDLLDRGLRDLTALLAEACHAPFVWVTLGEGKLSRLLARFGRLPDDMGAVLSLCDVVRDGLADRVFVVPDASRDERLRNHSLVRGAPRIRFFAGLALRDNTGTMLGSVCVAAPRARILTDEQHSHFLRLATQAGIQIQLFLAAAPQRTLLDPHREPYPSERELFFALSLDFLCTLSLDGRLIRANPALTQVLGWSWRDMLARRLTYFLHPGDMDRAWRALRRLFQGESVVDFEVRIRHRLGGYRWAAWTVVPILRHGIAYAVGRDVTERKLQETALQLALERADSASRAKSAFLTNMSHEIRTPLNALLGMAELLADTPLDADQQRYVASFRSAGDTLFALINQVLDLSKIEAGQLVLEQVEFDARRLCDDLVRLFAAQASARGLELGLVTRTEIPPLVGDPYRLHQILWNLVGNALKFTSNGGVTIELEGADLPEAGGFQMRCTVRDTGPGIAPEKLAVIFERFTQADDSTTRNYGGTGLGLSICRSLVAQMGGTLRVASTPGAGSQFSFAIPFRRASVTRSPAPVASVPDGTTAPVSDTVRILLVDDNEENRLLVREFLRNYPAQIEIAENGRQALAAYDGGGFDLILMDMLMPVMDGYAATQAIRHRERERGEPRPLPIIALTANAFEDDVRRCLAVGCSAHLGKPVRRSRLIETINQHLRAKNG